jgi:protein-tyrosine-phosphatase|tara:strand:- start:544 stop:768 length:225 start_codon:yes stop_codon:yes gene_type:complete
LLSTGHISKRCRNRRQRTAQQRYAYLWITPPQSDVEDVPDPYYGGPGGFEEVLDMIEDAVTGLLQEIRKDLIAR